MKHSLINIYQSNQGWAFSLNLPVDFATRKAKMTNTFTKCICKKKAIHLLVLKMSQELCFATDCDQWRLLHWNATTPYEPCRRDRKVTATLCDTLHLMEIWPKLISFMGYLIIKLTCVTHRCLEDPPLRL